MSANKRKGDLPRRKFIKKSFITITTLIGVDMKLLSAQTVPASPQNGILVKALEKFFTEKAAEFKFNPSVNTWINEVPTHTFSPQQKARIEATSDAFINMFKEAWEHDAYAQNFGYSRRDLDIIFHKAILVYFGNIPSLDNESPDGTGYARFQFEPYELVVSPKSDSMLRTSLHELSHFFGYKEQLANLFAKAFCGLIHAEDDLPHKPHEFSGYYEILLNKTGPNNFWPCARSYDKLAALWDKEFGSIMTCDELQMAGYIKEDFYCAPTSPHSSTWEKRDGPLAEKLGIKSEESPARLQTRLFELFSNLQKPMSKSAAEDAIAELKQFFGTMREFFNSEFPNETQSGKLYFIYYTEDLNKRLAGLNA